MKFMGEDYLQEQAQLNGCCIVRKLSTRRQLKKAVLLGLCITRKRLDGLESPFCSETPSAVVGCIYYLGEGHV